METWIGIASTLNVVLLGWLMLQISEIKKDMKDKASVTDLNKCRKDCHEEQQDIWNRVNLHKHTDDTGEVVLPR